MSDIHIIAEAGTNHNGQLTKAKKLVDIARAARADSVKFQIIYPFGLYLPGEYEYGHYDIKEVIRIRTEGMLQDEEYDELAAYCQEKEVSFTASVFDERGLDLLMKFNPPYIKIASCDLNNIRFLRQVAERGKKMVVSTGMSSLSDVEKSMNVLAQANHTDIVLLHCVSVYPAFLEQANLNFITTLKKEFGGEVGFSDHTGNSIAACMALAKGATWFEKHFTEDTSQEGFDHAYAMEEAGLTAYVADLHNAQKALSEPVDKLTDKERYTRQRARRSLYAARDMPAGEVITDDDVLVVRPEGIMDADQIDTLIGKKLTEPLAQHAPFRPEILS
ncbi:N-acetylneuraminate synthase family protein [Tunicatimonas pelagia]|uniref:N-acetylneuraminate synthase family protein n=1 Tax=Tunicatimonas pelagia TaxID=931531 RepID=UPI00266660B5|nr:N-acetylneuraminate synthase family protein [Tunicatimonas pelagia]WKN43247.1 N-acetylneuraminate synthase family protein [Tunicatimonas pelagia]